MPAAKSSRSAAEAPPSVHRQRLLQGMAKAVSAKGYATTTITDIVAAAAVSRRTFYEHFDTKADCLIAFYEALSVEGLSVLSAQLNPDLHWREQVEAALTAYFSWMAQSPELMRALFVEILALGPEGLKVRRRVNDQLAEFITQTVNRAHPTAPLLTRGLSVALVGGIHELVLEQIENGEMARVAGLAGAMAEFVR
ncbi:MAG: hypothetical protein RLZZ618_2157, partial [Pseudomonadota bacterium]